MSTQGFIAKDWGGPFLTTGDHDYSEGQFAVKTDTGEIAKVNADDIGNGIKAIGEGIAKIGQAITVGDMAAGELRPIYINGMAKPFTYIQETTTTTATTNWVTMTPNGCDTPMRIRLGKDTGAVACTGPVRTATYRTASDTMEDISTTAGVTWHIDYDMPAGTAWVYDAEHMRFSPEQEKKRKEAEDKSMQLLKSWLSESEYNYLMEGDLELPSQHEKDTIYIVNKDPSKRIGIKKAGKVIEKSLCIHTDYSYATGDQLLANIMLLKSDEKKFLEIANVHNFYA